MNASQRPICLYQLHEEAFKFNKVNEAKGLNISNLIPVNVGYLVKNGYGFLQGSYFSWVNCAIIIKTNIYLDARIYLVVLAFFSVLTSKQEKNEDIAISVTSG